MSDINYGVSVLSKNLIYINKVINSLLINKEPIIQILDSILDDISYAKNMVKNSINDNQFDYSPQLNKAMYSIHHLSEKNYLNEDIPERFKYYIELYLSDKKTSDKFDDFIIDYQKNIKNNKYSILEKEANTAEEIQAKIDFIHKILNNKKDMYILFRKIMHTIIKENRKLDNFYTFLSIDILSGEVLSQKEIDYGINYLNEYFTNHSMLTKLFNKDRINIQEKIEKYNQSHKKSFLHNLRIFINYKNQLSILLLNLEKVNRKLKKEKKDISSVKINSKKELSQQSYEFKIILELAINDYINELKEEKKKNVDAYCNNVLSNNFNYLILNRQKNILNEIIENYDLFILRLKNHKVNINNGLSLLREKIRQNSGMMTMQQESCKVINIIKDMFINLEEYEKEFINNINIFLDNELNTRVIEVETPFNKNNDENKWSIIPKIDFLGDYLVLNEDIDLKIKLKKI